MDSSPPSRTWTSKPGIYGPSSKAYEAEKERVVPALPFQPFFRFSSGDRQVGGSNELLGGSGDFFPFRLRHPWNPRPGGPGMAKLEGGEPEGPFLAGTFWGCHGLFLFSGAPFDESGPRHP